MHRAAARSGHRSTCRLRFPIRGRLAGACLKKKMKKSMIPLRWLVIGCDHGGTLTWPN